MIVIDYKAASENAAKIIAKHEARIAELEKALAAGDVVAHQLQYSQCPEVLENWWKLRGGRDLCTVCSSDQSDCEHAWDKTNIPFQRVCRYCGTKRRITGPGSPEPTEADSTGSR